MDREIVFFQLEKICKDYFDSFLILSNNDHIAFCEVFQINGNIGIDEISIRFTEDQLRERDFDFRMIRSEIEDLILNGNDKDHYILTIGDYKPEQLEAIKVALQNMGNSTNMVLPTFANGNIRTFNNRPNIEIVDDIDSEETHDQKKMEAY